MSENQRAILTTATKHKRKRSENDISHALVARVAKRPTAPAIRTSSPPTTSLFSNVSVFSPFSGQLTPVDTSEDESVSQEDALMNNSRLQDTSIESAPSIKLQVTSSHFGPSSCKAAVDTPIEASYSKPTRSCVGRARSNDIFSSQLHPLTPPRGYLPVPDTQSTIFPHDRIPTPITGHFNANLPYISPSPRHTLPSIHTNLSPMIEQETWGSLNNATQPYSSTSCAQESLPSPIADDSQPTWSGQTSSTLVGTSADGDAGMVLDDATTSSLSSLRVSSEDDAMETDHQSSCYGTKSNDDDFSLHQEYQAHNSRLQEKPRASFHPVQKPHSHSRSTLPLSNNGRMARLHMGFLAGCEKCAQQVPGHYSHILRSEMAK